MALYMIGLGLGDEKDITVRGLEIIRCCSKVYLEGYTSMLRCTQEDLEKFYETELVLADREMVEQKGDSIVDEAANSDVAFLVVGDPMGATTHTDLRLRAHEKGVDIRVIHNASILTAIGEAGLELYKYGKTTSIVFPERGNVETHYDVIKENKERGLHTLCLLDIKSEDKRYMTVNEAIKNLLDIENKRGEKVVEDKTLCVGVARMGSEDRTILSGTASELLDADFGEPLHALIIPGKLHFVEEDALKLVKFK